MGAKLQITSLTFGFLLYILDVGSDVYVAFRYYKNGQTTYFIAAVVLGAPPIIIVNIYATFCLRSQWKIVKCFLFITHLAMVKLFFDELFRLWKKTSTRTMENTFLNATATNVNYVSRQASNIR